MKFLIITLLSLSFLFSLFGCGPKNVYYGYSSPTSEALFPNEKNSVKYTISIVSDSTIKDKNANHKLFLRFTFTGEYQLYPKNLKFEIYEGDKKIPALGIADVNVTTVLDGRVSYFKRKDSLNNVASLIRDLKIEKSLGDDINYFVVSGIYKDVFLEGSCPEKINLRLKISWENGELIKDNIFELLEIEYGKASNRPFG